MSTGKTGRVRHDRHECESIMTIRRRSPQQPLTVSLRAAPGETADDRPRDEEEDDHRNYGSEIVPESGGKGRRNKRSEDLEAHA